MQPENIIAIWDIVGETLPAMEAEARSDASQFMGNTAGIDIQVVHCSPHQITNGRVDSWRGWAVASWGHVEPELLLNTIMGLQFYKLQSAQAFLSRSEPQQ